MSYASRRLRQYAPAGGIVPPPGPGGTWAGQRKVLTTDSTGALVNPGLAPIYDLTINDSYYVGISGPIMPNTTLSTATLDVDTQAGVNMFSQVGTLVADGDAGTYSLSFFLTPAQTRLLSPTFYTWSVVIVSSAGDRWTPVNGRPLKAKPNYAV